MALLTSSTTPGEEIDPDLYALVEQGADWCMMLNERKSTGHINDTRGTKNGMSLDIPIISR